MKPSSFTQRDARQFPLVDFNYQTTIDSAVTCCANTSKSLRNISRDYFDGETNREFLSEAAVFATLIGMAVLPIVSGVFAVLELCRELPLF